MRVSFRQGIVSHQASSFLSINGSGNVDLLAVNKSFTVNIAHKSTDYIHSEDNTFVSAWVGPFAALTSYWLYVDFNPLTFARTFSTTIIEPVSQSAEPGSGDAPINNVVAGDAGIGFFVVAEHYVLATGKPFTVLNSTSNDGAYTVATTTFNGTTGNTTITVNETIPDNTVDGELTLDIDSSGNPLLVEGRPWYDTSTDTHFVRGSGGWSEILRIFVAQLYNNTFISLSIDAPLFTGSQVGNTNSVLSGRVLFDESFNPLLRDDRTFTTTEDQFFTNQSRATGVRLESNVSKAQSAVSAIAAFTVISYTSVGKIVTSQYPDVGTTIVGLLTEDLLFGEVGSVVLQGVVTNPQWTWLTSASIGDQMWVENGLLVTIDPHISNPVTYPTGTVPVARVLSDDSVIFEQGLGGKGEQGPVGSIANLPPATVADLGAVTLVTAPSDAGQAFVISDTDSRLADSRNPLPHVHQATDITFLPGFGISANNLQNATEELAIEKLNISGGVMTGVLTLASNPATALEATTKQYVDNLVSGLIWLEPVEFVNLISDNITVPPNSPNAGDAYIIPPSATGDWSSIPSGNIVNWDNDLTIWVDHGPVGTIHSSLTGSRFGIAMQTTTAVSGSFVGRENQIANYNTSGTLDGFEIPVDSNAIYVEHTGSVAAFNQYAFEGTEWVLFSSGQNLNPDGTTIKVVSNTMSVVPWTIEGGTVDAEKWQGLIPTDLNTVYAPTVHVHPASAISTTVYNTSLDWGTLTNTSDEITSTQIQASLEDITDGKAAKLPTYATQALLPTAANVEGMFVYVSDINRAYMSDGIGWIPLVKENDTISLPYDLAFYITGSMQSDVVVGSFMITRNITVKATAPGSIAHAATTPSSGTYTLDIIRLASPYTTPTIVGTVAFSIGNPIGVIMWTSDTNFITGDLLHLKTPIGIADPDLENLTITIIGCAPTLQCVI